MSIAIRPLSSDDLELICVHRVEMFRDAGVGDEALAPMIGNFRPWLAERLADGRYFGFVATDQGTPVASVGLMVIEWPPHPLHPDDDRRGYILNMFVEPSRRRHGLGKRLMQLGDEEFRNRGVKLSVLHATEKGRMLYLALGWSETSEMAKRVSH